MGKHFGGPPFKSLLHFLGVSEGDDLQDLRERAGGHFVGDDLLLSGSQVGFNHSARVLMGFDYEREAEREEREKDTLL